MDEAAGGIDGDTVLESGEQVQLRLSLADGAIVVTDRRAVRVLGGGRGVADLQPSTLAGVGLVSLRRATKFRAATAVLAGATALLGAYLLYPFAPSVPVEDEAAGRMGVGGTVEAVQTALDVLGRLDDGLAVLGVLLVGYAAVTLARAWERRLLLRRSDGRRLYLSAPGVAAADVERLRDLLLE